MGTFLTNVQVHVGDRQAEQARNAVVGAIRSLMRERALKELPDGERGNRTVVVGPASQTQWVSVYDEATELQDASELAALAASLSVSLQSVAAAILVHDGDLLEIQVFRNGDKIEEFSNWPGYFTGEERPPRARGNEEVWRALLVTPTSEEDIADAWSNQGSSEDIVASLKRIARLVGWDPQAVSVGYRSLPDSVLQAGRTLCFGSEVRHVVAATEPTSLGFEGGSPSPTTARVGEKFSLLAIAHNMGAASRGSGSSSGHRTRSGTR
jgi:hypothetical protein